MKCASCGKDNPPEYSFCDGCGEALQPVENDIACPACSHRNPDDMKFCEQCGARLDILICPSCFHENPLEFKFCEECGQVFEKPPVFSAQAEDSYDKTSGQTAEDAKPSTSDLKKQDRSRASKVLPHQKTAGERASMPKLLTSLAMRIVFGSVVGFGTERVLYWLTNTLLSP